MDWNLYKCLLLLLFIDTSAGIQQRRFLLDSLLVDPFDLSCSFDHGSCDYSFNSSSRSIRWISCSDRYTYPHIYDHTTGYGCFMCVDGIIDDPYNNFGVTTVMTSPEFSTINDPMHLSFWRFINGSTTEALSVRYGPGPSDVAFFRHALNNCDSWKRECFDMPRMVPRMKIEFKVTLEIPVFYIGAKILHFGYTAIDDIKVDHGYCSGLNVTGILTDWSTWTENYRSYESSVAWKRTRSCLGPAPCTGDLIQYEIRPYVVPTHATVVSTWSEWFDGPCSVTCGTGSQPRLRECSTGTSSDCQGSAHQTVTCQRPICL